MDIGKPEEIIEVEDIPATQPEKAPAAPAPAPVKEPVPA